MTEKTEHTPGKWEYGVRKGGSMWLSLGDPRTGPHYQGDFVGREADAKLIVAAPDMLEALKVAWSHRPDNWDTAWDLVEQAIAKAEGRE